MEAPEKIYLQVCGDCNANDCENCKFEDLEDNVTWCKDKIFDNDIEYTRTDVFVKKAADYIANNMQCNGYTLQTKVKFIRDFKKYLED